MNNDLEKCKAFLTRFIEIWTTPIHEIKDYRPYYAEEETAKLINEIKSSGVLSTVNVEVKHGHWIYGKFDVPHCSECGFIVMPDDITTVCMNCGAIMDGDDE